MAKYDLNESAVVRARGLIDSRQYVLDSDWGEVQPRADAQNDYLESHGWGDYARVRTTTPRRDMPSYTATFAGCTAVG
jgi:hypothetical protein